MVGVVAELLQGREDGHCACARGAEDEHLHCAGAGARVRVYEAASDGVGGEGEEFCVAGGPHVGYQRLGGHGLRGDL